MLTRTSRVMRAELIKLFRLRLFYFGLVAIAIASLIIGVGCWVALRQYQFEGNGYSILAITVKIGTQMGTFFIVALGALCFSGEMNQRTMNLMLAHPVRRIEVFIGKTLVLFVAVIMINTAVWAVALVSGWLNVGYGDIVINGYVVLDCPQIARSLALGFVLLMPPLIAFLSIGLFISNVVENAGAAVTVGVLLLLFFELSPLIPGVGRLSIYFPSEQVGTAIDFITKTAGGEVVSLSGVGRLVGSSACYTVVLLVPSAIIFWRRDYAL